MKFLSSILFVFALLSMTGCAHVVQGRDIDQTAVESFKDGIATYEQIITAMGDPRLFQSNSDGTKTISYIHSNTKVNGLIGLGGVMKSNTQVVQFRFDSKNILISRTSSNSNSTYGNQ